MSLFITKYVDLTSSHVVEKLGMLHRAGNLRKEPRAQMYSALYRAGTNVKASVVIDAVSQRRENCTHPNSDGIQFLESAALIGHRPNTSRCPYPDGEHDDKNRADDNFPATGRRYFHI